MKAYQWVTLSAAVVITLFLHVFFTRATSTISALDMGAGVVAPPAAPTTAAASNATGGDDTFRAGKLL